MVWAGSSHNRLGRSGRLSLLFLFAFGLLLNVMKIAPHGLFMDMFGAHGLLFGVLLPLAVCSLIPTILIGFIAWVVVAVLEERRKHRRGVDSFDD